MQINTLQDYMKLKDMLFLLLILLIIYQKFKKFVKMHRPLIEIKIKPWGWDKFDWANKDSAIRARLGLAHYDVLVQTKYSDSGTAQILAPPSFLAEYQKNFGTEQ